jgi:hypothetical protein
MLAGKKLIENGQTMAEIFLFYVNIPPESL